MQVRQDAQSPGGELTSSRVVLDSGGWISGAALEIPRPECGRCEDWTTVVHKNNVISPCPHCRPTEFEAWVAGGGPASNRAEPTA